MSYINLIMFGAVLPSPKHGKDGEGNQDDKDKGEEIKDTDPDYNEKLRTLLNSFD